MPVLTSPDQGDESPSFRREKFVCETALLLYAAAARDAVPAVRERIEGLASSLTPHARSESLLAAMRLRPAMASELSTAHVCLTSIGYPDPCFHEELRRLLEAQLADARERLPWKDIEAHWLARIGRLPCAVDLASAVNRSIMARRLDALLARREDLYALTHGLIYLTDFGRQAGVVAPRPIDVLVEDVEMALTCCMDDDDFDLAAELLLTWPYLQATWTSIAAFGLSVLTRVEGEIGFLPSLSLRAEAFARLDSFERRAYVLTEGYHTAYVMGILSAALLGSQHAPPAAPIGMPCPRYRPGASRRLLELLPQRKPTPQWEARFASLPESQQDDLTPFVVTVGLRRAIRGSDFALLRRLLREALACRLLSVPAVQQAAELLSRLSTPHALPANSG